MTLTFPSGPIRTLCPEGGSCGIEWSAIAKWKDQIEGAASEFDVPAERIAATIVIESRGNRDAVQQNNQNGWSYGLLQVVPRWWKALIETLAGKSFANEHAAGQAMIDAPSLALRAGAAVLRRYFEDHGDWDKASSAFFLGNPDWRGADTENGNTGAAYRASLGGLMEELSMTDPFPVTVPYRVSLIPASNYNRPQDPMNAGGPRYLTVHETGNTNAGANAEMHRRFTHQGGGPENVSFHLVVDDVEAIQLLPFSEIGWHAGDGCDSRQSDLGCFDSIAIETCVNRDGNWEQTLRNLIRLCAKTIRENPSLSGDRIRQHNAWSGKNCPERIRREGRWDWLVSEVRRELAGAPAPGFVGLPAWLPADYFRVAFPSADPNGVVTKAVIEVVQATDRVPWFVGKSDVAPGKNLWRFDGFTLLNDGNKVWREGEAA